MVGLSRRRVLLMAVIAMAVLVIAEVSVRAAAPLLAEPVVYGDEATQVKVAQLDNAGSGCIDLVLAGNSMARDAFDPTAFTQTDPQRRRAYNASLDAASPALLRRWIDDEVVPRAQPTTVVVTVASLDYNARGPAVSSALAAYDRAPLTASGLSGRIDAWAVGGSALLRYRQQIRDPQAMIDALGRWREGTTPPRLSAGGIEGVLGADGQGLSRRALSYRGDAGAKAFTRQQLLADFTIDPTQVEATAAMLADLKGRGISVAVAVLPVTDDYVNLHPKGRADFEAFLALVRDVTTRAGVVLVDLHNEAPGPEVFADTHHLNATGASWFSTTLARRLAAQGVLRPRRCPA